MTTHQDKFLSINLNGVDYFAHYIERDWDVLGYDSFQNVMYNHEHGTVHTIVLLDAEHDWTIRLPDGITWSCSKIGVGSSFDECLKQLKRYHLVFQDAQSCKTMNEIRECWKKRL